MDNYTLALEKDRDTRIAELERCRSEVERFVAEVERLMRERDGAQSALLLEQQVREAHREAADDVRRRLEQTERERDEWKARAESAAADNAAMRDSLAGFRASITFANGAAWFRSDCARGREKWPGVKGATALEAALALLESEHPGAALLERLRTVKRNADWLAEAVRTVTRDNEAGLSTDVGPLADALAAYDAAKEGK